MKTQIISSGSGRVVHMEDGHLTVNEIKAWVNSLGYVATDFTHLEHGTSLYDTIFTLGSNEDTSWPLYLYGVRYLDAPLHADLEKYGELLPGATPNHEEYNYKGSRYVCTWVERRISKKARQSAWIVFRVGVAE